MTLKNDKTMAIFLRRDSYKILKESFLSQENFTHNKQAA